MSAPRARGLKGTGNLPDASAEVENNSQSGNAFIEESKSESNGNFTNAFVDEADDKQKSGTPQKKDAALLSLLRFTQAGTTAA